MLNRIVWIRNVWLNILFSETVLIQSIQYLTIKLYEYLNCLLVLNWIVWNGTILTLKLYLHWTKLFNIEMFWHLIVFKKIHTYTKLN